MPFLLLNDIAVFFFLPCACIFFSLLHTHEKKKKANKFARVRWFSLFFFLFTSVALFFFFLTVDLSHHLSRHFFLCGYYNCSTSSWGSNRKKKRKQRTIFVFLGEEEGRQVGGENAGFFFWFRRLKTTMTCQVVFGCTLVVEQLKKTRIFLPPSYPQSERKKTTKKRAHTRLLEPAL